MYCFDHLMISLLLMKMNHALMKTKKKLIGTTFILNNDNAVTSGIWLDALAGHQAQLVKVTTVLNQ